MCVPNAEHIAKRKGKVSFDSITLDGCIAYLASMAESNDDKMKKDDAPNKALLTEQNLFLRKAVSILKALKTNGSELRYSIYTEVRESGLAEQITDQLRQMDEADLGGLDSEELSEDAEFLKYVIDRYDKKDANNSYWANLHEAIDEAIEMRKAAQSGTIAKEEVQK